MLSPIKFMDKPQGYFLFLWFHSSGTDDRFGLMAEFIRVVIVYIPAK